MPTVNKFDAKLAEARYFLSRMRSEVANPDPLPLTANLRAFVGAARSAVLYAEEDAFQVAERRPSDRGRGRGSHPKVEQVREIHRTKNVLTFFQGLRNNDVHCTPHGTPDKKSHRLRVAAFDASGMSEPASVTVYTFSLVEWKEPGPDLFTLCEQYVVEIEWFLSRAASEHLIRR